MTVQETIDELVSIANITASAGTTQKRQYALEHAIEAIKVLQEIASEERFTIRDARDLIEAWFELVEAK